SCQATNSRTPSSRSLSPGFQLSNTRVAYCSMVSSPVVSTTNTTSCAWFFCVRALIWLVRVFTSLFVNVPVKSFTYLGDSGTGICVANTDEQKKAIRKIKFRIELPRLMSISILAKIYCWGFTYCGDIIRQIIFLWCVIHDLCG